MIKGTNTDCKITDISVVGSTATLTCLFFANDRTETTVGLQFLLIDLETDETFKIDNTTYWVDTVTQNDTNLLNVSVNGYKEVRLNVDITRNNKANMQKARWYRKCCLVLTNVTDVYNRPLWQSETINLVSEQIATPKIKDFFIYNKPVYVSSLNASENRLFIDFKYEYDSDIDFNYNNSNLKTIILIKSLGTGTILETIEATSAPHIKAESSIGYTNNEPILIGLYITNLKGEVIKHFSIVYKPFIKKAYGYIKTSAGIKKIRRLIIKDANKLIVNPNNLDVKLNYETPIYAHYDRHKYLKTIRNPSTHLDTLVEIHKCVLHIDTFISETNFKNVIYNIMNGSTTLITQNTDEDNNTFILQEDSNARLNVEEHNYKVNATYISENYTKSTIFDNINKTIVCSKKLKVHRGLYPFNYETIFGQEENNNE